jgi:hypothetical protein
VTVISRYFPEFEHELPRYLSQLHPDASSNGPLLRRQAQAEPLLERVITRNGPWTRIEIWRTVFGQRPVP